MLGDAFQVRHLYKGKQAKRLGQRIAVKLFQIRKSGQRREVADLRSADIDKADL